jgi:YD repeat-containing protein
MWTCLAAWWRRLQRRRNRKPSGQRPARRLRVLDIVLLEDRVPVSEQIGPYLALSALAWFGEQASPFGAPREPKAKSGSAALQAWTDPALLTAGGGSGTGSAAPPPAPASVGIPSAATSPEPSGLPPGSNPPPDQLLASLLNVDFSGLPSPAAGAKEFARAAPPVPSSSVGGRGGDGGGGGGASSSPAEPTESGTSPLNRPSTVSQADLEAAAGTPPPRATSPLLPPPLPPPPSPPPPSGGTTPPLTVASWPLRFEANRGQVNAQARFLARGRGYTLFLTGTAESVLVLSRPATTATPLSPGTPPPLPQTDVLRLRFAGARTALQPVGEELLPARTNYLRGRDPTRWLTDVPSYAKVRYAGLYPGVDLVYYGNARRQLEYDLVVAPGASIGQIQLAYAGADAISLDAQGNLRLRAGGSQVVQQAPVLYQLRGSTRQAVTGRYVLGPTGQVGFQVGAYDPTLPLVIDPSFGYLTYVGGSYFDEARALAVDAVGNAYITGTTTSPDFPTLNPPQPGLNGDYDVFVAKVNPTGSGLIYATYLGGTSGTSEESGYGIAVDAAGNAYVTGVSASTDFPTTAGALQTVSTGLTDAFVTKLNTMGGLAYSTLLGGSGSDQGAAIAVDGGGNAYLTGKTNSTDFPRASAYQSTKGAYDDAFVAKLNASGTQLVFSTYLGGDGFDEGRGIALDASNNVYVAGATGSTDFLRVNPYQAANAGSGDSFVTKFSASGTSLVYSTYLGGADIDTVNGLAVDGQGSAYVAGTTSSADFPVVGAVQATKEGSNDVDVAFVTKLVPAGNALAYSTYLGGSTPHTRAFAIAVDTWGSAVVAGYTYASDFPIVQPLQAASADGNDAFVSRLNAAGSALSFSTYLGTTGADVAKGVAFDPSGNVYVAGGSLDGLPTSGQPQPYQSNATGGSDAWVAKLDFADQPAPPVFTAITDDTGSSNNDLLTKDPTLYLNGRATPGSTVTVSRAGTGVIGTVTASPTDGSFSFNYTGTPLLEGVHVFTATATVGSAVSAPSDEFLVTVDTTPPAVTLTLPDGPVYDRSPEVRVTAADRNGLPNGTRVYLDVDLDNDGDFADPGETNYTTTQRDGSNLVLQDGQVTFEVLPELTVGNPVRLQARVTDRAGNEGASSPQSLTVSAVPPGTRWQTIAQVPGLDPVKGDGLAQLGNLHLEHPLDLDQTPCACCCHQAQLAYNSLWAAPFPVVQATVQTDNAGALPATISVQLTWDGTLQSASPISFSTGGHSPGELLTVAAQVTSPVTTSGRHSWSLRVVIPGQPDANPSGIAYVYAAETNPNPFGRGWVLAFGASADRAAPWRLVNIPADTNGPAGQLAVYSAGGTRFFEGTGGTYSSDGEDPGTLTGTPGSGFTYTAPDGRRWTYTGDGRLKNQVQADNAVRTTLTYDASSRPSVYTSDDGALATFAYDPSGSPVTVSAPGGRVHTLTLDTANGNLSGIQNPDAATRAFSYATPSNPLITGETWGTLTRSYAYLSLGGVTSGVVNSITEGSTAGTNPSYTRTTVAPAGAQGLQSLVSGAAQAVFTDRLGRVEHQKLDVRGRLTARVGRDGSRMLLRRNSAGYVTSAVDPLGRTTTYTVDAQGYVTEKRLPDDRTQGFVYDTTNGFHSLLRFTNERGQITTFSYYADGTGHLKTVEDALHQVTTYTWTTGATAGLLETVTDPLGRLTRYLYDSARRLKEVIRAEGTADQVRATMIYDAAGNLLSQTDGIVSAPSTLRAQTVTTSFSYDPLGRRTAVIEAWGTAQERRTTTVYDELGNVKQVTDPLGRITSYGYDTAARLARVDEAYNTSEQRTTSLSYDDAGNLASVTDPLRRLTRFTYDGADRLTALTEAAGTAVQRTTTTVYDAAGNVLSRIDPLGRRTDYAYDQRDRPTSITEAAGTALARTTALVYDDTSNVLAVTNPRGFTTSFAYDALDRRTRVIEAFGVSRLQRTTILAYDPVGNVRSVTDPLGRVTSFAYDNLDRQTRVIEAQGTAEQRTASVVYDSADNVVQAFDFLGRLASYSYDALNRVTRLDEAVGTSAQRSATFLYDAADNLLSVTTGIAPSNPQVVTTSFAYDSLDRRTQVIEAYGVTGLARTTTVVYDAGDRVLRVIDPLGRKTLTLHDALDRPTLVLEAAGTPAARSRSLDFDPADNPVRLTDPLGRVTQVAYDALDRATAVTEAVGVSGMQRTTTLAYDANDNPIQVTDPLGRLTSSKQPTPAIHAKCGSEDSASDWGSRCCKRTSF